MAYISLAMICGRELGHQKDEQYVAVGRRMIETKGDVVREEASTYGNNPLVFL